MGGGGSSSTPQFNAGQVAQQQTQSNVNTGVANALLSNTNQITPYGSLTYTQNGTQNVGGNEVPTFTATQTLSPEQKAIYDKTTGLQTRALDAASPLLDRVAGTLSTPLNFDNAPQLRGQGVLGGLPQQALDAAGKLNNIDLSYTGPTDPNKLRSDAYTALKGRSDIDLGRARDAQQVQLANQGIAQGSEAYNRAMEGQDRALVDASNQAFVNAGTIASQDANNAATLAGARSQLAGTQGQLAGQQGNLFGLAGNLENLGYSQDLSRRNQYINETEAVRNSPLQDYQALQGFSGGVTQPNFVNTAPGGIPATDVTSPQLAQYQAQLQAQQRSQSANNSLMGGLFGLGGSVLGGLAGGPLGASLGGMFGSRAGSGTLF